MLYSTYRELVLPEQAERYWRLTPAAEAANGVAMTMPGGPRNRKNRHYDFHFHPRQKIHRVFASPVNFGGGAEPKDASLRTSVCGGISLFRSE
jgi:hypothetical protein